MNIEPIGVFHCSKKNPYEAARQGSLEENNSEGYIQLKPGKNFEQALERLQEFSHVWILFHFHHNQNWKPKVLPPRGSPTKVGVFASRSPYRPNPIGMSCVKLKKIQGLKIEVEGFDLLDQTPVLDIKPYLPYADSFPKATNGWIQSHPHKIEWSSKAEKQLKFLIQNGITELKNFTQIQLSEDPTNNKKKRITSQSKENHTLAYRTWRIVFTLKNQVIKIKEIQTGYTNEDLIIREDKHKDKKIHKAYLSQWPRSTRSAT